MIDMKEKLRGITPEIFKKYSRVKKINYRYFFKSCFSSKR